MWHDDRQTRPLQRLLRACFLGCSGRGVAGASFDLLAVLQLTAGAPWAGASFREVWTLQSVLLLTLLSCRTVASDKILTHFSVAGDINMTVGTVTVVTDALEEVGTHRHLLLRHLMGERADTSCLLARPSQKSGADGHLVRVVYVGTVCATVTFAEAVVVHAILLLLLLLTSMSNDGKTPLDRPACEVTSVGGPCQGRSHV